MTSRNFTCFPVLITERLTLRQLSIDDHQDIFALRSDNEINKYLDRRVARTPEDAIDFINKINDNLRENVSVYWAITLTETRTFAGTICLYDFSTGHNSCEIGYELLPDFQGRGIMKEAAEKVIEYAFQTLRFQKIIAITHRDNQRSARLLRKLIFISSKETFEGNPDFYIFTLTESTQ
ncbi:GNAT family N-acetyltransferase [Pollutibacter soli]|uniref:GNAT family N-acetyltransferase n=1 Tax=Pollutibacter soli TaxID=3034157 RepID=UPI0030133C2C